MNKREARAYVCGVLASTLRHDLGNGSGWIYSAETGSLSYEDGGDRRKEADIARIEQAIRDEIAALEKRAAKAKAA